MVSRPVRYWAVGELSTRSTSARVPCATSFPPRGPAPRADVDEVIGGADGVFVVLHHDDRVAQVPQPPQRGDEPVVVALVQADARLVQHVKHPRQPGADLRGQPDALAFPTGERAAFPVQIQVAQAYLYKKPEAASSPRARSRRRSAAGCPESSSCPMTRCASPMVNRQNSRMLRKWEPGIGNSEVMGTSGVMTRLPSGPLSAVGHSRDPFFLLPRSAFMRSHLQRHRQNLRPEPRPLACRARLRTHERLESVLGQFALAGIEQILQLRHQALERLLESRLVALLLAPPASRPTRRPCLGRASAFRKRSGRSANGLSNGASNAPASPRSTAW